MWLFTPMGFFSAVLVLPTSRVRYECPEAFVGFEGPDAPAIVMVRARVAGDLWKLSKYYGEFFKDEPPLKVWELPAHDYPARVFMQRGHWASLVAAFALEIDYSNFKDAVEKKADSKAEGQARHDLYMKVWTTLNGAESWLKRRVSSILSGRRSLDLWGDDLYGDYYSKGSRDPRSDSDMDRFSRLPDTRALPRRPFKEPARPTVKKKPPKDMLPAPGSRGWESWLDEDEERAVIGDAPRTRVAAYGPDGFKANRKQ